MARLVIQPAAALDQLAAIGTLTALENMNLVYDPEAEAVEPLDDLGRATAHLPRSLTAKGWLPHPLNIFTDQETGQKYRLRLWNSQQPTTTNQPPTK